MKLVKSLFAFVLVTFAIVITLPAADPAYTVWAGPGTGSTTLSYCVVPHTGKSASGYQTVQPVLTYLNATSDTNASKVQFYNVGTPAVCNFTNLGTTAYVALTNTTSGGVTAFTNANGYNGKVLIYNKATKLYHVRTLGVAIGATNLVMTVATTNLVGDLIWPLQTAGSIPVGVATKELNGPGIYAGDPGEPLLFDITGGTNCAINAAAARYYP